MSFSSIIRRAVSLPYEGASGIRSAAYRRGIFKAEKIACSVVSVGNLTFGGTGKTPTVAWLANAIRSRGYRPGILSRGYRGGPAGNDEAKMLASLFPELPHVQNPDRVAGGKRLIEQGVDAVLLDDGFQHLRLRRDLDLLLIDATDPFGGGACPPGGRLREPIAASARADLLVLTRADLVGESDRERIWRRFESVRNDRPRIELAFAIAGLLETAADRRVPLASLKNRQFALLSAIGNPAAFRRTVEAAGLSVQAEFRFRDHHHYTHAELERVFRETDATPALTTAKDWAKIREFPQFRPWVLEIEPKFLRGEEFLQKKLDALFPLRANR